MTGASPDLVRAQQRAKRLYRAPGFRQAYIAGARAAVNGRPVDSCPYPSERSRRTWRSAYRKAWLGGYLSVARPSES